MKKIIIISAISACLFLSLPGQVEDDLDFIIKHNSIESQNRHKHSFLRAETSEIKLFFLGFFYLYKTIISSQDRDSCIFTVSCSSHGVNAIRQFGVAEGLLLASDRLQRCHSAGMKYYPIDPKTGHAIDFSLKDIRFKRKRKTR